MTLALALTNLVLGVAYTGYGVMTLMEMKRDWRTFGFSHFGLAWIFMAFTCGPHHLDHALHLLGGRGAGPLDLLSVAIGLPVGVVWLSLRIEAFLGGRGDRFIPGTPGWVRSLPVAAVVYFGALVAGGAAILAGPRTHPAAVVANIVLVGVYLAVGWFVLRTQLANRPGMGGWSVSGLSLAIIFPTCAVMHGVWAMYAIDGRYTPDIHGLVIDWLSIPAAVYFLWVVRRLYRDALSDWNDGPGEVEVPAHPVLINQG